MSKGTLEVHAFFEQPEPSIVITTEQYPCINTAVQRKNFYAKGLHWQTFFLPMDALYPHSNAGMYYKTSPNGIDWSEARLLIFMRMGGLYPDFFSLHFDGTYVHIAYAGYGGARYTVIYRKGIPNPDGTITWIADEQAVHELDDIYCCDPIITIDSEGCPWIGFYYGNLEQTPVVIKSSRNDGIWEMAPGFPYFLNSAMTYRGAGVLGLLNNKVYALHYRAFKAENISPPLPSDVIYGKLWNGVSWEAQEQVSSTHVEQKEFHQLSYVSNLDDIYLVFLRKETGKIVFLERTSGWSQELIIATTTNLRCHPQITYCPATDTIIILWNEGDTVYYRKRVAGVWQPQTVIWWKEFVSLDTSYFCSQINSNEKEQNGIIGVAWLLYDTPSTTILKYNHLKFGGV